MARIRFEAVGRRIPDLRVPVKLTHHAGDRSLDLDNHLEARGVVAKVVDRMKVQLPLPEGQGYVFTPDDETSPALKAAGAVTSYYSGTVSVVDSETWETVRTVLRWELEAA